MFPLLLGAIRAIIDSGLKVPEDISVVGCYNTEISDFSNPRISSVNASMRQLSSKVADKVLNIVEKKDEIIENVSISTGFVKKASA